MLENRYRETLENFCREHLAIYSRADLAKVVPKVYEALPDIVRPTPTMTQDIVHFILEYIKNNRTTLERRAVTTKSLPARPVVEEPAKIKTKITTKKAKKHEASKVSVSVQGGPQRGPDGKFLSKDHPLFRVDGKTNMEWNLIERSRGIQRTKNGQQKPKSDPTFIHASGWTTEQIRKYGD